SRALGEFGATLMLVGVTRMKTETLPAGIYLHISTGENGMAMATAVILLVLSALSITLTGILNRRHQLQTRGVQS
ncbi:MAG: nitrogen fixation protein NifC, partial [Oscillospiraceae bacterium]